MSEETARKRISRAVERLRVIFARRGVVVSSLALAAAFAAHGAQAAPLEAAASWANVALAKAAAGTAAASSGGGILAFVTSAKAAVLIAVLVLGGGDIRNFQVQLPRAPGRGSARHQPRDAPGRARPERPFAGASRAIQTGLWTRRPWQRRWTR